MIVDPKVPHIDYYAGAALVTPNHVEAESATNSRIASNDDARRAAQALRQRIGVESVLITRGEHGMWLDHAGQDGYLPASAREVADVTGAGDTVIATLALAIAAGGNMFEAARLANEAASIVVGKFGAATVAPEELKSAFQLRWSVAQFLLLQDCRYGHGGKHARRAARPARASATAKPHKKNSRNGGSFRRRGQTPRRKRKTPPAAAASSRSTTPATATRRTKPAADRLHRRKRSRSTPIAATRHHTRLRAHLVKNRVLNESVESRPEPDQSGRPIPSPWAALPRRWLRHK